MFEFHYEHSLQYTSVVHFVHFISIFVTFFPLVSMVTHVLRHGHAQSGAREWRLERSQHCIYVCGHQADVWTLWPLERGKEQVGGEEDILLEQIKTSAFLLLRFCCGARTVNSQTGWPRRATRVRLCFQQSFRGGGHWCFQQSFRGGHWCEGETNGDSKHHG